MISNKKSYRNKIEDVGLRKNPEEKHRAGDETQAELELQGGRNKGG